MATSGTRAGARRPRSKIAPAVDAKTRLGLWWRAGRQTGAEAPILRLLEARRSLLAP